jgi:hypothetical protein
MKIINFVRLVVAVSVSLAWIVPAMSDEPAPPEAATASVHNYGRFDKTCMEWTDGCRVCILGLCSNIGIACQPKQITCTSRRTDLDNKSR